MNFTGRISYAEKFSNRFKEPIHLRIKFGHDYEGLSYQ